MKSRASKGGWNNAAISIVGWHANAAEAHRPAAFAFFLGRHPWILRLCGWLVEGELRRRCICPTKDLYPARREYIERTTNSSRSARKHKNLSIIISFNFHNRKTVFYYFKIVAPFILRASLEFQTMKSHKITAFRTINNLSCDEFI